SPILGGARRLNFSKLVSRPRRSLIVIGILALLSCGAGAAPGDLDLAFGKGGIARFGSGRGNDEANAAAIQRDGRILVAGWAGTELNKDVAGGSGKHFALLRFNTDGTPDLTVGPGGRMSIPIGNNDDAANAMRIDFMDRIVLAGYSSGPDGGIAV